MKRYDALDVLRGISIFGMVFCATIPYGVLPTWMYHIQTPPPLHNVDLTLVGLSWVDLVFPVFIFCMGVAISLSGSKKLNQAGSPSASSKSKIDYSVKKRYLIETFERFLLLWLFSYLYLFLNYSSVDSVWAQLLTIAGFLSLFPLYGVLKTSKYKSLIRFAGVFAVAAIIYTGHTLYDEVISIHRSGIIIFLLAFLYLFGSLIWFFTRESIKGRFLIFLIILLFSGVTMHFRLQQNLYAVESIRWIVNLEYIYFLLILLPATYIGDLLVKKLNSPEGYNPLKISLTGFSKLYKHLFYAASLLFVAWQCYALYMRLFLINIAVSVLVLTLMWQYIKRYAPTIMNEFLLSAVLLIAGLIIDPVEGGIQKSPCTISYCFVTVSIGIWLLWFAEYVVEYLPGSLIVKIFKGSGSNPMMSYIAFNSFLIPLFKATSLIVLYKAAFPAEFPWVGVASAAFFVLLMMSFVSYLSSKKIFWRA